MNSEQLLLDKWRTLPLEKQQLVLDYVEELDSGKLAVKAESEEAYKPKTELGKKLWEIRRLSLANNPKLLTWDEVDAEISDRRVSI
jgi:hypothetical protein